MKKIKRVLSLVIVVIMTVSCLMIGSSFTASAALGNRDWKWPVPSTNKISSCYLDGRAHYALDICGGSGSSIYASYSGTVIYTYTSCPNNYGKSNAKCGCGKCGGLGNSVYIKHTYNGTSYVSRYGHLASVKVKAGDTVSKNTVIGTVGSTGDSTGFHLDFRIYKGSSTSHVASRDCVDPFKDQFLEMPSGLNAGGATTQCCYTYVNEVKSLYSSPVETSINIPNGYIYKIKSYLREDLYIDIDNSVDPVGANAQIWSGYANNSSPNQMFQFIHVKDGWYKIKVMHSGMVLDVKNAITNSGTNLWAYTDNGSDAQLFKLYDAGNGYCYIKSKLGCYIDVDSANTLNGTNVQVYSFNGSNAQKWKLMQVHSYSSSVTKIPTCASTGIKTFKCVGCGTAYTESIAKNSSNHSGGTNIKNAKAATCTTTGYTGDTYCSGCNVKLSSGKSIDKISHSDTNDDGYCDNCKIELRDHTSASCSCGCHSSGFNLFIWKIVNFFHRIFGMDQYKECACGNSHW